MACRQHDAEFGIQRGGQVSDAGSRDHPEPDHIDAAGREARGNRGLEELAGGARITPDHRDRSRCDGPVAACCGIGEHAGGSGRKLHGKPGA